MKKIENLRNPKNNLGVKLSWFEGIESLPQNQIPISLQPDLSDISDLDFLIQQN